MRGFFGQLLQTLNEKSSQSIDLQGSFSARMPSVSKYLESVKIGDLPPQKKTVTLLACKKNTQNNGYQEP